MFFSQIVCFTSYGICFTPCVVILLKILFFLGIDHYTVIYRFVIRPICVGLTTNFSLNLLYKLYKFIQNRHSQVYALGLPALELMRGGVSTAKGSN